MSRDGKLTWKLTKILYIQKYESRFLDYRISQVIVNLIAKLIAILLL